MTSSLEHIYIIGNSCLNFAFFFFLKINNYAQFEVHSSTRNCLAGCLAEKWSSALDLVLCLFQTTISFRSQRIPEHSLDPALFILTLSEGEESVCCWCWKWESPGLLTYLGCSGIFRSWETCLSWHWGFGVLLGGFETTPLSLVV